MSDYIDEPDVLLYEVTGYYADLDMVLAGQFVPDLCTTIWLNMRDLSAHSERKYGEASMTLLHFVSGQFFVADVRFADFHSEYCAAIEDPQAWSTKDEEDRADGYGLMQILPDEVAARYEAHLRGELASPVLFDMSEGKQHPDAIMRVVGECETQKVYDEAVSLSYWLAKQLGEHVDDASDRGESLTDTVERLINHIRPNAGEADG